MIDIMWSELLLLCAAQQASYTFSMPDAAQAEVHASLELRELNAPNNRVTLTMPQGFAYAQLPTPRLVGEVEVSTGIDVSALPTIERLGPYQWEVNTTGAQYLILEWTVPLDHRDQPEVRGRDEYEYPYLRDDHGMLVMGTLALAPEQLDEEQIKVCFELPEEWDVHAPWPRDSDGNFRPGSMNALRDDLIAVGDWQIYEQAANDMQLKVAFARGQSTLYDVVVGQIGPIVSAMLDHFGTTPQANYLFLFGEPQLGGYGGSPKTQSMTLYVDPNLPSDFAAKGIVHLIAHEFHHTWMRARCQPVDELRFVAEGFTDYFAYLIPKRIGMLDESAWRTEMERQLALAESSQLTSGLSLQNAGGGIFFKDGTAYQTVYSGGLCLALWLDLALQRSENPSSTEDMLRALYENPRWKDGVDPTPEHLWAILKERGYDDIANHAEYMSKQKWIDWQQAFAMIELELTRAEQPAPLSMRANFNGTTITDIDPNGTGARIGLKSGDVLVSVNGVEVSSQGEIRRAFPKLVDDEKFVIVFMRGETQVTIDHDRPSDVKYTLPEQLVN